MKFILVLRRPVRTPQIDDVGANKGAVVSVGYEDVVNVVRKERVFGSSVSSLVASYTDMSWCPHKCNVVFSESTVHVQYSAIRGFSRRPFSRDWSTERESEQMTKILSFRKSCKRVKASLTARISALKIEAISVIRMPYMTSSKCRAEDVLPSFFEPSVYRNFASG